MKHHILLVVLPVALILNVITFVMYGIDKRRAIKNRWRIPESTLIGMAFAYGGIGALLGMYVFRHKTRHKKFTILVPMAVVMQIVFTIWLCF